jgi:anti-sigma B factor antagonist
MHVRSRRTREQIAIVTVYGNMRGGPELRALHKSVKRLTEQGFPWIVIDIGNVDWMNSAGLGALISCMVSCQNHGGNVVVARPTRKVRSLFMITQVMKLFETRDSQIAAVEALREMKGTTEWHSVASGPEDWAFVRDRLQARAYSSPGESTARSPGRARRPPGRFWRSLRLRPLLGLWGGRMIE